GPRHWVVADRTEESRAHGRGGGSIHHQTSLDRYGQPPEAGCRRVRHRRRRLPDCQDPAAPAGFRARNSRVRERPLHGTRGVGSVHGHGVQLPQQVCHGPGAQGCPRARERKSFGMNRPVVTVTRRLPDAVEAELREQFDTRLNPGDTPLGPEALRTALESSDALLCTVTDRLDATVLRSPPVRARILANYGVGFNHIDLAAARALDLVVTNTPGVLTEATAELG